MLFEEMSICFVVFLYLLLEVDFEACRVYTDLHVVIDVLADTDELEFVYDEPDAARGSGGETDVPEGLDALGVASFVVSDGVGGRSDGCAGEGEDEGHLAVV